MKKIKVQNFKTGELCSLQQKNNFDYMKHSTKISSNSNKYYNKYLNNSNYSNNMME